MTEIKKQELEKISGGFFLPSIIIIHNISGVIRPGETVVIIDR